MKKALVPKGKAKYVYGLAILLIFLAGLIFLGDVSGAPVTEISLDAIVSPGQVDLFWETELSPVDSFKIYRGEDPGFVIDPSTLIATVAGGLRSHADPLTVTDQVYYYQVRALTDQGNHNSNRISIVPMSNSPHGSYANNSFSCNRCHDTHKALGPTILGDQLAQVCYRCHGAAGSSTFNIEDEYGRTGSTHPDPGGSCSSCHDAHDGGKDAQGNPVHLPRLLEITVAGAVNYQGGGNDFCFTCHQNLQSNFPAAGTGHNSSSLASPDTSITCAGCHEQHGSQLTRLLKINPTGSTLSAQGNDRTFCYSCHEGAGSGTDNAWDGKAASERGHSDTLTLECRQCHSPHGTSNPKNLLFSYDGNYGTNRTMLFFPDQFQTCFQGGCHDQGTFGESTGSNFRNGSINLHQFHLNDLGDSGNAVCKECHRPHGTRTGENAAAARLVGFPAATVTGKDYAYPKFVEGTAGGSCNLVCHGTSHDDTNSTYQP
ncbi:MAG: cytochrome c3 family protein [Bacillota bacterium]